MKKIYFPYLAVMLGLLLLPVIILGTAVGDDGSRAVPLISLLILNEFAFFAVAIGVFIGVKHLKNIGFMLLYSVATVGCFLLMFVFMFLGTQLWPL